MARVVEEILQWSATPPPWERLALDKILSGAELTAEDENEPLDQLRRTKGSRRCAPHRSSSTRMRPRSRRRAHPRASRAPSDFATVRIRGSARNWWSDSRDSRQSGERSTRDGEPVRAQWLYPEG